MIIADGTIAGLLLKGVFYFPKLSKVHGFIGDQLKTNRDFLMQTTLFFSARFLSILGTLH